MGIVVLFAVAGCHHGGARPPAGGTTTTTTDTPPPTSPTSSGGSNQDPPPPGVVSFINVTSNRVADVSSLDAWRRAFIHDGMSDADKAQAVWRSVVAFGHQDEPPREFLEDTGHVHDPIKLFNVYGYSQCDCSSAMVAALGRAAGLTVRGRSLTNHSVPEVSWTGAWHMLDGAYVTQFPKPDGTQASVDELVANVTDWLTAHPGLDGNASALASYQVNPGWKTGPSLLAACPYFSADGFLPTRLPSWTTMMEDYDRPSPEIEFGFTLGYRVNVQLRAGERLVRNWSNQGHHINDDVGLGCESLTDVPGTGPMAYTPMYGDLAPGRVGNGTHEYEVPLAGGQYRAGALVADNLRDAGDGEAGPRVGVGDATKPAVLVERMASSYIALGGTLELGAQVPDGGAITVSFSRNHGVDWVPIATVNASGTTTIDLTPWVRRQYDYRLRFVLTGGGTGLDRVHIVDSIQHSQRALPALAVGDNVIDVAVGPNEGTITLAGSTDRTQTHNVVFDEYHPVVEGISGDAPLHPTGASGAITFPVTTPGPMKRLRFGLFYRARGASDAWQYQVSFDGGATFQTVATAGGPTAGDEKFISDENVPAGVTSALIRFAGSQSDTLDLFSFRIDADYTEPQGGAAPVAVTYSWSENGAARSDTHVVSASAAEYSIHCDSPPQLGSLVVERVAGR